MHQGILSEVSKIDRSEHDTRLSKANLAQLITCYNLHKRAALFNCNQTRNDFVQAYRLKPTASTI